MGYGRIIMWIKRATGIGYRQYPPLDESILREHHLPSLKKNSEKLVRDFGRLEQELKNRGLRMGGNSADRWRFF